MLDNTRTNWTLKRKFTGLSESLNFKYLDSIEMEYVRGLNWNSSSYNGAEFGILVRRKIDSDLYKSVKFSIFTNITQYALKCRLNQLRRYATIHATSSFVPD